VFESGRLCRGDEKQERGNPPLEGASVGYPYSVILVSERRAEEGHDPIAHDLVHPILAAVDGLHHSAKDRVEDLPSLLQVRNLPSGIRPNRWHPQAPFS